MSAPEGDVVAVTMFCLKPGVDPAEFERFSTELDQPTCLAVDVVLSFDAYRVTSAPDGSPADVLEVMHVADWAAWEQLRDNDPAFAPVMDGFTRLVDLSTVRTWFTHTIIADTHH
ncbi:hypothetical protein BVC93_04435 [Mycobacterium sp. MS1601]|uniref:hypothetical protein n=1 Tax=Mycobacterium sp. MS1601 TaxID=1936029 RepID=UPI0009796321|nr:hypothetical protein [Mycobacterium sp. MS1601]AQA01809.1 hypothetical protein BVC93_04435 [Mycobacterium sp. MS1601]